MGRFLLFYRLMLRPLLQEPVRATLTILAVTLGVAVVLAIDLAGTAATGSFRASMETLAGDNDLEIVASSGGVPETVVGTLATFPYSIRISPRIEDSAVILNAQLTIPLIGVDMVAEGSSDRMEKIFRSGPSENPGLSTDAMKHLQDPDSIWVGASLGKKPGDRLRLLINDQVREFTVRGVYPDSNGNESAVLMDLAAAQSALNRFGRVDRILLKVPEVPSLDEWQHRLRSVLPPGVEVRPQGTGTNENLNARGFPMEPAVSSYIALLWALSSTTSIPDRCASQAETGIVRACATRNSSAAYWRSRFFRFEGSALGLPVTHQWHPRR
jgi:putative ABC transport system permease protein